MELQIFLGIFLIATGAFSAGSFAVPFGKIKGWKWESYWMVYSLGAYIILPVIACFIFAPGWLQSIKSTPNGVLTTVFLLGALYGIGNLSFGLALRYLGLSLGYALSLGLMLAIGTLIPPLIDGRLDLMFEYSGGNLLLAGIFIATMGIAFSAWAGILKDKSVAREKKQESIGEFNLVLLSGTFISTLIWCIYLGIRNKSIKNYYSAESRKTLLLNYGFGLLAGLLWFSQFIFYGMGKSKMGTFTFTSWGILMALTIGFASVWGVIRGEWKGASTRVYVIMACSLFILIAASFMIGISGSL